MHGAADEESKSTLAPTTRIGVLGLGNVLRADDAIGPYVVRVLDSAYRFPPAVQLLDLGTPGPELAHYLSDFDAVIVVDTVMAEGSPGHVVALRRDAIVAAGPSIRFSPHDPGLREALLTAELEGGSPREVLLIGVVPAIVELETGLSSEVKAALPHIQRAVLEELRRLGVTPHAHSSPPPPDIWWER